MAWFGEERHYLPQARRCSRILDKLEADSYHDPNWVREAEKLTRELMAHLTKAYQHQRGKTKRKDPAG